MADITIPESSNLYKKLAKIANVFESPESVLERVIDAYDAPMQNKITSIKLAKPKKKITLDVVKEIYLRAKDVYEERIDLDKALNELEDKMNKGSAWMYINTFKAMRQGKFYTGTINTTATKYFLEQIFDDYKEEGLELALKALDTNIEYFEGLSGNGKLKRVREIRNEFSAKLEL